MFLSLVELRLIAGSSPALWREVAMPYGAHRALWRLLSRGPDHRRDFLFRQEIAAPGRVRFYVLSRYEPRDDELWSVRCKPFAPKLERGNRLGFSLRASPTVRGKVEGKKNGPRHDVIMRRKHASQDRRQFDLIEVVQTEGLNWLSKRAAMSGFELASGEVEEPGDDGLLVHSTRTALKVDGYRQHRLRIGERDIRFSTVDYEGLLRVTDPKLFLERIARGFGPEKAFGCGLMLLRRTSG